MGKQLTTEEVKKMNLDILSVVADFCEKNGLRYWLYYGTLIGAIRHNGYIPWDDDIDIIMPRPDYEKFLKSFNQTSGSKYQVIEDRITPGYHTTFAKVHNPKTIIESEFSNEMAFGVFIDIFPFDGVKDAKQSKCAKIILKLLSAKDNKWWRKRKLISNIGLYVFKIIMLPIPVNYLLSNCTLRPGVVIGQKRTGEEGQPVTIGDNVDFGIGVKVFGSLNSATMLPLVQMPL